MAAGLSNKAAAKITVNDCLYHHSHGAKCQYSVSEVESIQSFAVLRISFAHWEESTRKTGYSLAVPVASSGSIGPFSSKGMRR